MTDLAVTLRERRARRLPAVLTRVRWPVVAAFVLGAAWTIWFVWQCQQYFIQPDELEYVKQSRQIASELHPLLPGDRYFNSWSQLQPFLLAPVWAIDNANVAHRVMGVVNALIMASAAIPAYLIARRVVAERWAAYLVAFLTVAIPWMAAASTMMTEVAAYPAFLWGVLAVQHAIARPSVKADVLGLLGVGLAFSARPQLAVLAPALVGGALLQELRFATDGDPLLPRRTRIARSLRDAVRRHWLLIVVAVLGGLLYLAVRPDVFGGYGREGVTTGVLNAPGLWEASRETLAYVAVGTALLPLALAVAWALQTFVRPLGRDQHAYALVLVIAGVLLVIAVGSFTARYTPQGINSRYLYYLAPLLFVAMAALVVARRAAAIPLAIGGLLTAWIVFGAKLAQSGPSLVSPDQTFHTVLDGRTYLIGRALGMPHVGVPHLLGVVALVAVLALALLRRGRFAAIASGAALVLVTVFCLAETGYSLKKIADTQRGVDPGFISGRRWVDEAMPPGQKAQLILSTLGDPASAYGIWWDVNYWNSSIERSMTLPTTPDLQQPFPQQFQVHPDGSFGAFGEVDAQLQAIGPGLGNGPYFVRAASDRTFGFRDAQVVAEKFGIQLVRTPSPPRAAWALYGTADDTGKLTGGGAPAELRVFPRTPMARESVPLKVVLTTSADAPHGRRWRVGRRTGFVGKGKTAVVHLRVRTGAEGFGRVHVRALGKPDATAAASGLQITEVQAG